MSARSISKKSNWLTVENSMDPKEPTIIHIAGFIGDTWWDDSGKSATQFRDELDKIPKGNPVTIKINSEGGVIKDGLGMYDAIKERSNDCTVQVVGYACSTASWLGLAAKSVRTADNAVWMIHESAQGTYGNKRDHTSGANCLNIHDKAICGLIATKTGKTETAVMKDLESEKWMTGNEAREYGLADEVEESSSPENLTRPVAVNAPWMTRVPDRFKFSAAQGNGANNQNPPRSDTTGQRTTPVTPPAASLSAPKQGAAKTTTNQTTTKMEKSKIIALLNKRGVAIPENATDEQLLALLDTPAAQNSTTSTASTQSAATAPPATVTLDAFNVEKRKRISGEVKRRGENKITNENLTWWIDLAMNDEEKVFAQIDALPTASTNGGEPLGRLTVVSENPLENIKKMPTAAERVNAMKRDWDGLYTDACARDTRRGAMPLNTNTVSATLVTSFLMDGCITNLQNVWAALKAFSMDFSTDPYKPLATGVLKQATVGATTQTDATNFESGDSTLAPISVTMHQYTQSFQVSNTDLNSGVRMENLVTINSANFANKVIEVATAPITVANFTGDATVSSAAAFSFSDLAALQALLKKSPIKNLILDGAYIARIANTPGFFQTAGVIGGNTGAWKAFGWDVIAQNTDWTGAGANVVGFACHPQAIVGITGLPLTPANIPGGILSQTTFTVPGLEVPVALYTWFNPSSRTMWTSYDIMAGFAKGDATAGFIVKSA